MGSSYWFKKTLSNGLAVLVVVIIVGIVVYILSICPSVVENLAIDPNAQETLGGLCKSISSKVDSLP